NQTGLLRVLSRRESETGSDAGPVRWQVTEEAVAGAVQVLPQVAGVGGNSQCAALVVDRHGAAGLFGVPLAAACGTGQEVPAGRDQLRAIRVVELVMLDARRMHGEGHTHRVRTVLCACGGDCDRARVRAG